jgi:hypothetical protein
MLDSMGSSRYGGICGLESTNATGTTKFLVESTGPSSKRSFREQCDILFSLRSCLEWMVLKIPISSRTLRAMSPCRKSFNERAFLRQESSLCFFK